MDYAPSRPTHVTPFRRTAPPRFEGEIETLPGQIVRLGHTRWRAIPPRPTESQREALASGTRKADSTGLTPYVPNPRAPWNRRRVMHLVRRLAFGVRPDEIEAILAMTPGEAVDVLVDTAASLPPLPEPEWANDAPPPLSAPSNQQVRYMVDTLDWVRDYEWEVYREFTGAGESQPMRRAARSFREKLTLFWHGHFVTAHDIYFLAPWLYRYWSLLRRHAFGDFRQFVHDIGITPAMLVYLNGIENRAGNPNENYARELMELFTMGILDEDGQPTYTEADVQELSRVLTGWGVDHYGDLESHPVRFWHDSGQKTVLGQTGNWDYNDVIPLLFSARAPQIARFICRKMYRAFVSSEPDETVVDEMAMLFRASEWQIAPVLKALFKSAHFYSYGNIGSHIKSPVENTFGFHRTLERPRDRRLQDAIWNANRLAGQVVFDPPTVAGWPGHREWMNTAALSMRWTVTETLVGADNYLRDFITSLASAHDVFDLVAELAELMLGLPPEDEILQQGADILLNGAPPYEWDPNARGALARLVALVDHFGRLPEHQLA